MALLRTNAGRRPQLHILDPGTGEVRPLNAVIDAVGDIGAPAIPYRVFRDGRTVVFYGVPADAPPGAAPGVDVIDVSTDVPRLAITLGPTVVTAVAVDPRDRSLLISIISGDGQQVLRVSPDGGAPTRLGEGQTVACAPRRDDLAVQLFSFDGGSAQLARMPVTGGATTPIVTRGSAGLASPSSLGPHAVRDDGAIAVAAAVHDSWFFRPAVLDPETGGLEPVALADDRDYFSLSWGLRGEIVAGGFLLRTGIWRFRPDR